MDQLGGLAKRLPFIGTALIMALLAGCGLPGFANFVGEAMVFFGAWTRYMEWTVLACWAGLVIGGITMVRAIRTMLHGPLPDRWTTLADAPAWRRLPFAILLAALLTFGIFPRLLTDRTKATVSSVVIQSTGINDLNPIQTATARLDTQSVHNARHNVDETEQ